MTVTGLKSFESSYCVLDSKGSYDLIVNSTHQDFNDSENMVNILTINSILVNIDIISGSYVNGFTQPTIYSFFPDVSSGYNIIGNFFYCDIMPLIAINCDIMPLWRNNAIKINGIISPEINLAVIIDNHFRL